MAITVKHLKVSTVPDGDDTSVVRPSDWNADHTLVGMGTMAEQNADSVAITGGSINGTSVGATTAASGKFTTVDIASGLTLATDAGTSGQILSSTGAGTVPVWIDNYATQVKLTVKNDQGTALTKGQVVYVSGANGTNVLVKLAQANSDITSATTIGFLEQDLAVNDIGLVVLEGSLTGLNTSAATAGDPIWLSGTTPGGVVYGMANKPQAPTHLVYLGVVVRSNINNGEISVQVNNGWELDELHNVKITSPTTGQTIVYDSATQLWNNSGAVVVSGGSVDNSPIGATTPSTGTFTTLTAQTEVLKGTGENLLLQSQTFATSPWANTNATLTANSTTAPDSTNTAFTLAVTTGGSYTRVYQSSSVTGVVGNTMVFSVYAKANTTTNCSLRFTDGAGTETLQNFTLTSSWQRISISRILVGTSPQIHIFPNLNGLTGTPTTGDSIYIWGAQLEIGSVVNTYISTTTTAVYGTPTLSFSGVAGIGLQSDGSLYHQPAGTGAVQAQATTSSAVGGNARGANAVDWQTSRTSATQVASGQYSTINGGLNHTSSSFASTVAGGGSNSASNFYSFIGGGSGNQASGYASIAVGGVSNTATGYYGFVGNGMANSTTSNSAVTTQSGTMNGTTAVTLSGSNASIKVGQFITGTSIANNTYVAAISGTSLTLSQNASGSSTSTLSFYTPHGVVVGGGNNQATGSYSFIGGGGDAGTAANRNVASGDWSVVVGGRANQATGNSAFVGAGGWDGTFLGGNTASANYSSVVAGFSNSASAGGAFIGGGQNNSGNGIHSFIGAGAYGTARSIVGNAVFSACNQPISGTSGINQAALLVLARQTTDATATVLTANSSAAGTTNQVILPNNAAYYFKGSVIAGVTGAGNSKAWSFEGAIKRGANAAATSFVGTPVLNTIAQDAGASTWTVALSVDTTNGGLTITVTGQAATTIRWVAKVETTEMTY